VRQGKSNTEQAPHRGRFCYCASAFCVTVRQAKTVNWGQSAIRKHLIGTEWSNKISFVFGNRTTLGINEGLL
jgi:hypothetical protein